MKTSGRGIRRSSPGCILRLFLMLLPVLAGSAATAAPREASADGITVWVDEDQWVVFHPDGSYTPYASATLRWSYNGQPNGYIVKCNGQVAAEYDSTVHEHPILTVSHTFDDDLDVGWGLLLVENHLALCAHANGLAGHWEVETTCGAAHGETWWWPTWHNIPGGGGGGGGGGSSPWRNIWRHLDPRRTVTYSRTLFSFSSRGTNVEFSIHYDAGRIGCEGLRSPMEMPMTPGWIHNYSIYVDKVDVDPLGEYPHNYELHLGTDVMPFVRYTGHFDCPYPYVWFDEFEDAEGKKLRVRIRDTEYLFKWYATMNGARLEHITAIKERTSSENFGHTLTFAYYDSGNHYGKLQSITDSSGRTYTFTYWDTSEGDGLYGALKWIEHPSDSDIHLAEFRYKTVEAFGVPTRVLGKVEDAKDTSVPGDEGQRTEFDYTCIYAHIGSGRRQWGLTAVRPSAGVNTYYALNTSYALDDPYVPDDLLDPEADDKVFLINYDSKTHGTSPDDTYGKVTVRRNVDFDWQDRVICTYREVSDANDWTDIYRYGKQRGKRNGQPLQWKRDGEGNVTYYTYDDYENCVREVLTNDDDYWLITIRQYYECDPEEAYWSNVCCEITRKIDFNPNGWYQGHPTYYDYLEDELESNPDYTYDHDDWGRLTLSVDSKDIESHIRYKELDGFSSGLLEKTWIEPPQPDDTPSKEVTYDYYASGSNKWLLQKKTEKLGPGQLDQVTEYDYYASQGEHKEGMLKEVLFKEGNNDPEPISTEYFYDETRTLGVPTSIKETGQNADRTTEFTYDLLNRVTSKTLPAAESGGDRYKTEWTYHWYDDVRDVVKYYGSDEIEKTRKEYSTSSGWLETEWVYKNPEADDPTPAKALKTSYTYYDNGQLETVTSPGHHDANGDPLDIRTKYVYFANGLKKEIRYYEDENDYDVESFTYYTDQQVKTATNCLGNVTEFEYDDCGRQSKVTDALDGETTYEYEAATTRVTSETTPTGEEKKSTYDKFGRLEREKVVMGVDDTEPDRPPDDPDDIVTEYDYDEDTGQLVKMTNVMDPDDPNDDIVTEYEYDFMGRQEKITYAPGTDDETTGKYTYTAPGTLESEKRFMEVGTPDRYIVTEYTYDELDQKTTVTTVMGGDDIVITYGYDDFVFSGTDPYVLRTGTITDPLENETETTYDVFGRAVKVTNMMTGDDIVTEYEYDKNGNTTKVTDAVDTVTKFDYDHRNRLVKTTYAVGTDLESTVELTLDVNGNVTTSKDQLGKETDYTYDDLDRLTKTTYADGTKLELTRDAMGRVTEYKDQIGRVTTFDYDAAGRLVKSTGPDGKTIELTLDALGNVEIRTDQEGNETEYTYDALGRLTVTTYEDNTTVERTYDGVGNLKTLTDQRSNTTSYEYDDAGRLIKMTYPDTTYEQLTLDALGNVEVRRDRNGKETSYDHDELGRLKTVQYPDNGNTITYTYDKMSRITSVLIEDSAENQLSKVSCDYDELGRLEQETQELATAGTANTVSFDYDLVGNRTDMDYPGGTSLTIECDDVYRVTQVTDDAAPGDPVAAYTYNNAGEVTRLDLKNGTRADYTYDAVGRLETLVNRDPANRTISSNSYQRNGVGCPTRITYHDGRYRDYEYDKLYRLTREEHVDAYGRPIFRHDYDYDGAGNRTSKQHESASGPALTYAYNNMNQLTDLTGTSGNRTDVAGTVSDENLSSVTVYNTSSSPLGEFETELRRTLFIARGVELVEDDNDLYALALDEASNEERYPETGYHTVTLDSSVALDYVHDGNGCLVEIVEGTTRLVEYHYDYENRLVKVVEDPDGTPTTPAEYEYDGLGRRVWSDVGGIETRYIYDGDSVIEEYLDDSGWTLAAVYVHGIGVDNVLTITRDGATYYYHYDGLGSVTELTDVDGALVQAYEYDAWGIATIYDPSHASHNPYLFTGRRWDAAIALYYYRARHYAPHLGRFLQPDLIGYEQTTNLYAYVGSSPTVFVDPTGMEGWVDRYGHIYMHRVVTDSWDPRFEVTIRNTTGRSIDEEWQEHDERAGKAFRMRIDAERNNIRGYPELETAIAGIYHTFKSAFDYGYDEGGKLGDPWFGGPIGEALGNAWGAVAGTGAGATKLLGDLSGGSRLGKGIWRYDIDGPGRLSADRAEQELYAGLRESGLTLLLTAGPAAASKWLRGARGASLADDAARAAVPDEAVVRTQGGRPAPVTNPRANARTLTETQGATKPVRPVGGRLPSNYKYAGKTYCLKDPRLASKYPGGVPFTESGFADLSGHAIKSVPVKGLTGNRAIDAALANKAAGLARTPAGFTWHHVEDAVTMQLVPSDLHIAVPHTGGGAILRRGPP